MSIIGIPFEKVGIDIVGTLLLTSSMHKYILVMVDHGTFCPEALPLRNFQDSTVAQAVAITFSLPGFPKQVLMGQWMQFMSNMWKYLRIQPLHTSVYHPQINGFVESFNGTLKSMMQKSAGENVINWLKWLPFYLSIYL